MKKLIKRLFNFFGLDIVKARKARKKSSHSRKLSHHKTATGNYYLPTDAHHDIIAKAIKEDKIFEQEVVDLACKYIRPGTAVLDVGSNFGQMAILFARKLNGQGKVYAFDADDFVFDILKRNIEANSLNDVIIPTFGAVHNVVGETLYFPIQDFDRFGTYGSYGIDYNGKQGRPVPSVTIDSLEISEPVSFMKVDVQGGDLMAMKGALKTIERYKMPILFEYEYHFEEELNLNFQEYVDFVASIDYRFAKVINGHNYLILPKKS